MPDRSPVLADLPSGTAPLPATPQAKPGADSMNPHPSCRAEHLTPARAETLNAALKTQGELRRAQSLLRDLVKGCDDDHCPLTWQAAHERALLAEAKADVYGTRLALASRALRSKQAQHLAAFDQACDIDTDDAIAAALHHLRRKT